MKKNHQTSFEIIFDPIEELQPLTIISGISWKRALGPSLLKDFLYAFNVCFTVNSRKPQIRFTTQDNSKVRRNSSLRIFENQNSN